MAIRMEASRQRSKGPAKMKSTCREKGGMLTEDATILRSMRRRMGACKPYILRWNVSFALSCVASHWDG